MRGVLVGSGDGGRKTTLAEYAITKASSAPRLLLIERGQTYHFIKASVDARNLRLRFERSSYKPGTIIVEFSILQETLVIRHAYGPQHGATPSTVYRMKRLPATAD